MGDNLTENGYSFFEIDESEIIGNNEVIYWMFGIIDRITKENRVFLCINWYNFKQFNENNKR